MSQSAYGYNSQIQSIPQADASTSHKIDMLCLAILVKLILFSLLVSSAVSFVLITTLQLSSSVILSGSSAKIVSPSKLYFYFKCRFWLHASLSSLSILFSCSLKFECGLVMILIITYGRQLDLCTILVFSVLL